MKNAEIAKRRTLTSFEQDAMGLEKIVDGVYQHLKRKHGIDDLTLRRGYGQARRLRMHFRKRLGSRQRTLTTGSKQFTTKGYVYLNPYTISSCCDVGSLEKGLSAVCWFCHVGFTKATECKKCRLFVCPACEKCGCNLSEDAREKVYTTLNAVFKTNYWKVIKLKEAEARE